LISKIKTVRFSIFFRGCNQHKFIHITAANVGTFFGLGSLFLKFISFFLIFSFQLLFGQILKYIFQALLLFFEGKQNKFIFDCKLEENWP
jgi:hypothetical protein